VRSLSDLSEFSQELDGSYLNCSIFYCHLNDVHRHPTMHCCVAGYQFITEHHAVTETFIFYIALIRMYLTFVYIWIGSHYTRHVKYLLTYLLTYTHTHTHTHIYIYICVWMMCRCVNGSVPVMFLPLSLSASVTCYTAAAADNDDADYYYGVDVDNDQSRLQTK